MLNSLKNILIVGGSGFVGSHTADILSIQGYKVRLTRKHLENMLFNAIDSH